MPQEQGENVLESFMNEVDIQSEASNENISYENFSGNEQPGGLNIGSEKAPEEEKQDISFEDEFISEKKENQDATKDNSSIDFGDEKANEEIEENVFKEEEALEKLKALGYEVSKKNEESADQLIERQINDINSIVGNLEAYLSKNDEELCNQKALEDLKAKYTNEGNSDRINSEEFKLELESALDEYKYNPRMQKLEATMIRSDIKKFIDEKNSEKKIHETSLQEKQAETIKTNRLNLQESFKGFVGKKLLGQEITPELIKESYKQITSGKLTQTINNDQTIQAEIAMYLQLREKIPTQGNATYEQGVADTVNSINNRGSAKPVNTSLDKTVARPGAGNSIIDRISSWGSINRVEKK